MKKVNLVKLGLVGLGLLMGVSQVDAQASSVKNEKQILLRLAENQPETNPVTVAMRKFSSLVKEKTNGSVIIEVYASAQLGSESENIEQVQAGILDMARVNSVTLAQLVSPFKVFTLPYIFENQEHKFKVLNGEIGKKVLESLDRFNMIGFDYLEAGTRNFYTVKKPIKSVSDLKGQKIRVQKSEVVIKMVKLLGGIPTPMNYGEVFTSLQTGVIDGAENDFVSYSTSGHSEVAKHYTLDGHLSPPALVIISKRSWAKLSKKQKIAVREASKEATEFEIKAMNAKQLEFQEKVEKSGTKIYSVNVREFQDRLAPLYNDYPEFSEVIKSIRALQ